MRRSSEYHASRSRWLAVGAMAAAWLQMPAIAQDRPTFRANVDVVPITAVVRDSRHRVVKDLTREDFQVLEQGSPRRIIEFTANADGPVSIAVLFDTSGSMAVASNLAKGKAVVARFLERLRPHRDEIALFTFHKALRAEVPFTNDAERLRRALDDVKPWGLTSMYDAVAETAKQLSHRGGGMTRRAIVLISDGVDTSSALSSREVAALASAIDVPVYVVAVVSPLDRRASAATAESSNTAGGLGELAEFTGGEVLFVSADDPALTIDSVVTLMRHQYFMAIESAPAPGWYEIDVKTKRRGLRVRARRAYSAGLDGAQLPR